MVRQQAEQASLSLKLQISADLPDIAIDETAIRQCVINLVTNALKFTPPGGMITLCAAHQVKGAVPGVIISVADTGRGIPAALLPRITQPFEQSGPAQDRRQGAGLGLAIVKGLTELHGGDLTLASEEGKGTVATIWLPIN